MSYSDDKTEHDLQLLEKKLRNIYRDVYAQTKAATDAYFEEFEERYEREYEKYMAGAYTDTSFKNWVQTQLARGAGWEKLRDAMANRYVNANLIAAEYINGFTPKIFALNANFAAYEVSKDYENVYFDLVDENVVADLVMKRRNNIEFKTCRLNVKRDYKWNSERIQTALVSSIIRGDSIKEMADCFMVIQENNKVAAVRNARTACTSAQNAGRITTMRKAKEQGVDVRKRWLSAHDGRVRDSHAHLDGQIRDIDELFDNGLRYPADSDGTPAEVYNCRCTLTYIYPKYDKNVKSREDYSEHKKSDETYQQWLKRMYEKEYIQTVSKSSQWGKTVGTKYTDAQRAKMIEYAANKGIRIDDLRKFDGKEELLKASIDNLSALKEKYGAGEIILSVERYTNNDVFGEFKGKTIYINNLALRDRVITENNMKGNQLASQTLEDITNHEFGHYLIHQTNKNPLAVAKEAYYNVYNEKITDEEMTDYLFKNLSEYSVTERAYKRTIGYWEIPSEMHVAARHGDRLGMEYIKLITEG